MKNFIGIDVIIEQVATGGEGKAVYSNRSGLFAGVVDSENVFTPVEDVVAIAIDFITETEGYKPAKLQPAYNELGNVSGFTILITQGEQA